MTGTEAVFFTFVFIMVGGVASILAFCRVHSFLGKLAQRVTIIREKDGNQ